MFSLRPRRGLGQVASQGRHYRGLRWVCEVFMTYFSARCGDYVFFSPWVLVKFSILGVGRLIWLGEACSFVLVGVEFIF